jgi:predicted lipoprotein
MVRDALEFIKFDDFNNQIEFANISREINFYIRDNIVPSVDDSWKPGMVVDFLGAFTLFDGSEEVMITPVQLELSSGDANE